MAEQRRILVVEDDVTIALAVRNRLAAEGFDVRVAGDGQDALVQYGNAEPDLVILDRLLPGSTAWRCAAGCRPPGRCPCSC